MNGIKALRQVLIADAALTALVPATRIAAGVLPLDTALPAISVSSIGSNDRNLPSPGTYRHVSERVQVTVMAATYPSQKAILKAVRHAAADQFPTVSDINAVTIHTETAGPDFMDEAASIYLGSQDFRVTFSETR